MVTKEHMNPSAGFFSLFFKSENMPEHLGNHIPPVENITEYNKVSSPEFPVKIFINNSCGL